MSLSRLATRCRTCPFVDTCDHKEMEAYGVLPLSTQQETIIFSGTNETSGQVSESIDLNVIFEQGLSYRLKTAREVARIYARLGVALGKR